MSASDGTNVVKVRAHGSLFSSATCYWLYKRAHSHKGAVSWNLSNFQSWQLPPKTGIDDTVTTNWSTDKESWGMAGTNSRCLFQGRASGGFRPSDKLKGGGGAGRSSVSKKIFFRPFRPQFVLNIRGSTSPLDPPLRVHYRGCVTAVWFIFFNIANQVSL